METYNWLKLAFIFFAFLEAFLMGLLPVKVKSFRESLTILGIANAFSGGVFIAIALLHIMPEATEHWNEYQCEQYKEANPDKKSCPDFYQVQFLILVSGYGLMLILDKVVFDAHSMLHDDEEGHEHGELGEHGGGEEKKDNAT